MISDQFPILTAEQLFSRLKIDPNFPRLKQLVGLDDSYFVNMYLATLKNYAVAIQLVPASESHHHARPGGLLEHSVDLVHLALKLRQGYKLPIGATPEVIVAEANRWTFGVFIAALLHDIGKLISNFRIVAILPGNKETYWTPLHGDITSSSATAYKIEFRDSSYNEHSRLGASCLSLVPAAALGWIAASPPLFHQLVSYLCGEIYDGSAFSQIVTEADRASVAKDLKVPYRSFTSSRKRPLVEHILMSIRQLALEKVFKRNTPGAIAWTKEGLTYFVCRPLVDRVRGSLSDNGVKGFPSDYLRVYDILLESAAIRPNPHDEYAAIWNINVSLETDSASFNQKFSVLVFESSKVWKPTRQPDDFVGTIKIIASTAEVEPKDVSVKAEPTISSEPIKDEPIVFTDDETGANIGSTHENETIPNADTDEDGSTLLSFDNKETDIPAIFLDWIRSGVLERKLEFNQPKAFIHVVDILGTGNVALVTPAAFKAFCLEHDLGEDNFEQLQRRFSRRKWNTKTKDTGQNVHPLWTNGKSRSSRINCWIIPSEKIFGDKKPPSANKFIVGSKPTRD